MISPLPKTFYMAIEGHTLREGVCPPLRTGRLLEAALCATPHRMSASFANEPKLRRLGNCLYRIRGRIRAAEPDCWVINAHLPILCNGQLPSCFAPRKWVEGVFSLTFHGQKGAAHFAGRNGCGGMVRKWKIISLYRDDAFWDMVRSDGGADVPLHGQVARALRYFEEQGAETHWHRLEAAGADAPPDSHYLAVLEPEAEE